MRLTPHSIKNNKHPPATLGGISLTGEATLLAASKGGRLYDKLCVSSILNGPPFDVFFSSFQTAFLFYIKRSFHVVLTSLKLPLNHTTIAWFATYKKRARPQVGVAR